MAPERAVASPTTGPNERVKGTLESVARTRSCGAAIGPRKGALRNTGSRLARSALSGVTDGTERGGVGKSGPPLQPAALLAEAHAVAAEDAAACSEIGRLGHELLQEATSIGTHCNAGRLATAGTGTALAPMYAKAQAGEPLRVFASETRPLLQGARLTAWELEDAGIDVTVVPDGAMASTVLSGEVDAYIVGADRIAANGDTANKIGTVSHALAAREAGIPFYVAAPTSTIDINLPSGDRIEIEQRNEVEVHEMTGTRITPQGVNAANPAFDVTPHHLITAIITEVGVLRAPFEGSIADALTRTGAP